MYPNCFYLPSGKGSSLKENNLLPIDSFSEDDWCAGKQTGSDKSCRHCQNIDQDKNGYQVNIFLMSPPKHMLWRPTKALLMSTNNICFCGDIRKISVLSD